MASSSSSSSLCQGQSQKSKPSHFYVTFESTIKGSNYGQKNRIEKMRVLLDLLRTTQTHQGILVFCNNEADSIDLAMDLSLDPGGLDLNPHFLSPSVPREQRDEIVHGFKTGKFHVLVMTDFFARGFEVQEIPVVINYDLPSEKSYCHRLGLGLDEERTGITINIVGSKMEHCIGQISSFSNLQIQKVTDGEMIKRILCGEGASS